jgi:predicted phage tail protein
MPSATVPGIPTNMTAAVSGTRATLRWQAPTTGGTPANYLIFVGSARGWSDLVNAYNVGNVLGVSGDLPRGTYYARSRAQNSAGTSLSSNEVTFQIGRKLRSPEQLRAYWTRNRVTITWVPAAADTAEDVPTSYVLEAGTQPGLSNAAVVNVGNTTTFAADVNSGVYYVRVRARNDLGESDPSAEIEIRTPGAPQPPTAFMQSGQGPEVTLRWTAPVGGYAPTGYVIEAGSAPGLANLAVLHVGNVVNFTTTAPPGTYYVRVRAVNASGASLASNEIVVRR